MSNFEFLKTNNNEISDDAPTKDSTNDDVGDISKAQNIKSYAKDAKDDSEVTMIAKEGANQKVFLDLCKNVSSASENNSNILSYKEMCSNGFNENYADTQKEEKCLKSKLEFEHREERNQTCKATNDIINFAKGNISTGENSNDNTTAETVSEGSSSEKGISDEENLIEKINVASDEAQGKNSQPVSFNLNIVPNPNEFNLVEKKTAPLQNSDYLNLNQSNNELLVFSDNSIVISNSNAIPQSDSIVSSNYSLSQLQQYMSDDDEDSMIEELPSGPQQFRDGNAQMEDSDNDSDSSSSSSTSIIVSETSSESESEGEFDNTSNKPVCKPIKAKGELDLCDLPPIEDLMISVPEEECTLVGKIYRIVDQLVIVQANKDTPAYDLDTILFSQGGKPLGKVFDVMGPVTEPYYCIRFNSKDHIEEKNIALDQPVYAAPKTHYSKFVFLAQLMKLKGSDASWENDVEPPEIYLDYSDDEQEQIAKKKLNKNKKATKKPETDPDEPARKRHSAYVKKMNARNLKLTASRNNQNPKSKADGKLLWQLNLPSTGASPPAPRVGTGCHQMFGRPPMFDRVPQPSSPFPQIYRTEFSPYSFYNGPSTSSRGPPPPFQPCHSPGPSNSPRMSTFSPPPPYSWSPSNHHLPSTSPSWNSSYPQSENPWANPNPFPVHTMNVPPRNLPPRNVPPMNVPPMNVPPMRISTPPTSFPFPPGPFPVRSCSPRGPTPPRAYNNRGNAPQYNFNPYDPPNSNFFKN